MATSTYKGFFKPINFKKYRGNPTTITYRSGWELEMMVKFDKWDAILEWSSEEIVIPYTCPITGKLRRYFPDFYIKKRNKDGAIEEWIIEVKPLHQAVPPKMAKDKKMKTYLTEVTTYSINQAKWKAARFFCERKNYRFVVVTKSLKNQNRFVLLSEQEQELEL